MLVTVVLFGWAPALHAVGGDLRSAVSATTNGTTGAPRGRRTLWALVAGEFDYFLIVRTKDLERFNKLHAEEILTLPGVRQMRTFFVLKQILSTTELPV